MAEWDNRSNKRDVRATVRINPESMPLEAEQLRKIKESGFNRWAIERIQQDLEMAERRTE